MMSLITESSLMLASVSVFWIRWTCRVCSRTSCLRVRIKGAQLVLFLVRDKARLEQPEGGKVRQPRRILHVRLAAGNRL